MSIVYEGLGRAELIALCARMIERAARVERAIVEAVEAIRENVHADGRCRRCARSYSRVRSRFQSVMTDQEIDRGRSTSLTGDCFVCGSRALQGRIDMPDGRWGFCVEHEGVAVEKLRLMSRSAVPNYEIAFLTCVPDDIGGRRCETHWLLPLYPSGRCREGLS